MAFNSSNYPAGYANPLGGNFESINRWGANGVAKQSGAALGMGDRINSDPAGNSSHDLWLPTWSGEVLNAYDQVNMLEGMVDTRTLDKGVSVEFPVTGTVGLTPRWEAGQELAGGGSAATRFSIGLDRRPIAAHFEIDNIDVMIQQFDFRSEMARQAGMSLANERDRQIGRLLVRGAQEGSRMHVRDNDYGTTQSVGNFDARYGGSAYIIGATGVDTSPSVEFSVDTWNDDEQGALYVLAAIEAEQVRCRTLDINEEGLFVVVRPELFNQIRRLGIATPAVLDGTTQSLFGVAGGRDDAKYFGSNTSLPGMAGSLSYLNATIVSSNHLPLGNYTVGGAGALEAADANYAVDATGIKGLMFRKGGVASIKKQGMKVDTVNDVRRNSVFTVASMFHGGGILRPEFCSVLYSGTGSAGTTDLVVPSTGADLAVDPTTGVVTGSGAATGALAAYPVLTALDSISI